MEVKILVSGVFALIALVNHILWRRAKKENDSLFVKNFKLSKQLMDSSTKCGGGCKGCDMGV